MSRPASGGNTTPWYRLPLVWMLIAIPASAVIGGMITLRLAIQSDDGLVVDDYYKHGKEINRVLQRDEVAAAHALRAEVALDFAQHALMIRLTSGAGYTPPEQLDLQFLHATRAGYDARVPLVSQGNGRYLGALPSLPEGRWHLLLEAEDWRLLGELRVPGPDRVVIAPRED